MIEKRKETSAPAEPGWYYAIPKLSTKRVMRPVYVQQWMGGVLFVFGQNLPIPLDVYHWFGPLIMVEEENS